MAKYAIIINNVACNVRTEHPGGYFTPNIVEKFEEIPDHVKEGDIFNGTHWIPKEQLNDNKK